MSLPDKKLSQETGRREILTGETSSMVEIFLLLLFANALFLLFYACRLIVRLSTPLF
jgi:hypothetical protein